MDCSPLLRIVLAFALLSTQLTLQLSDRSADPAPQGELQSGLSQSKRDNSEALAGQTSVNILSDTRGTDFRPYIHQLLKIVGERWRTLLPEEAHEPTLAKGRTFIRFTIDRDGKVSEMLLDASTHDNSLNRAAWQAIKSEQPYAALPTSFTGQSLTIRIEFRVNLPTAIEATTPKTR